MKRVVYLFAIVGCGFGGAEPDAGMVSPTVDAQVDATPLEDALTHDAAPACPPEYELLGTGAYRHVTTAATWNDARDDCADDDDAGGFLHRTHLVVLDAEVERVGVRTAFAGPKLWLGLSDRVTTGTWRWVTLEDTATYPPGTGAPWKGGQPDDGEGGSQDCVVMEGSGSWDDQPCDTDTEEYICECDAHAEVATQSDPQS